MFNGQGVSEASKWIDAAEGGGMDAACRDASSTLVAAVGREGFLRLLFWAVVLFYDVDDCQT